MSPLLYTGYSNIYDAERMPWGETVEANGNDYIVRTDLGNQVLAWVSYGGSQAQNQSWCHGFSLGTHERWGYSVYSGRHVARVLADEYRRVNRFEAQPGDIIAWRTSNPNRDHPHTAILKRLVLLPNGWIDFTRSLMDSKNGPDPVQRDEPILTMVRVYGSMIMFYRKLR
ncbi:hypothetical protein [Terrimonas ferruginea]|uniref:hypothetical protein n=1 Tax=Terrimonas ferruginea TaxID=249 RepID=UPI0004099287|nr:hypothetical protein [Terrimonas ferruginea]